MLLHILAYIVKRDFSSFDLVQILVDFAMGLFSRENYIYSYANDF